MPSGDKCAICSGERWEHSIGQVHEGHGFTFGRSMYSRVIVFRSSLPHLNMITDESGDCMNCGVTLGLSDDCEWCRAYCVGQHTERQRFVNALACDESANGCPHQLCQDVIAVVKEAIRRG